MFSSKQSAVAAGAARPAKSGAPRLSFIGPEVIISGDLATDAQLHVDGRIDGNVRCAQLCQGADGIISGNIHADEARLAGTVEGTVTAASIAVEASARILGDIAYDTISIEAGARIEGRLGRRAAEPRRRGAAAARSRPRSPSRRRARPIRGWSRNRAEMSRHVAEIAWRSDGGFTSGRYSRRHEMRFDGGAIVAGSSSPDVVPAPLSDPAGVDPEELLVASAASCHMLWFLDLARRAGLDVAAYRDRAEGEMGRNAAGKTAITRIALRPDIAFAGAAPDAEAVDQPPP